MKIAFAVMLAALTLVGTAFADGLTQGDDEYLQKLLGLTPQSAALTELTPNEQQALHSAIDDLSRYPESRDLQVKRYLALAYGRECKRWAAANPGGTKCSPAADQAVEPGKEVSDKICATCHLFGGDARSFHSMANEKTWDSHKLEHALRHTQGMVPIKLTPQQLDALTTYLNSFKSP